MISVGMIGCGGFARWHMKNLLALGNAQISALCDPDHAQIARCIEQFPSLADALQYSDHRSLLDQSDIDAVEICTPHSEHVGQILDSLAAGKHVMCEKPMVTSSADARRVIDAHHGTGLVGLIGYQRHQIAEYQYMRHQVGQKTYGEVRYIAALQSQEWKRLTTGTWRQKPELSGGGQLNDSGSHFVDIILWTSQLKPDVVSCQIDACGTEVDINSTLSVRFRGGALGTISIIGDAPNWHEELTLWCERGAFFMRDGKLTVVQEDGTKVAVEGLEQGSQNPDEHFIQCILGNESPLAPFEGGLGVIQLTEAAWKSAAAGGNAVNVE